MKVPISWLADFVEIKQRAEDLAEILTFGGLEVEEVYDHYEMLGEVVAVRVLEVEKPEALQGLVVCHVHDGKESFSVLTSAVDLVRPGKVFALARPGSKTFLGDRVEVKEVRGYPSYGMFLSPYEAGVSVSQDDLLELPANTLPGERVYKVLKLSEPVLEIAITPNRGDCLSILGIARELSLLTGTDFPRLSFSQALADGDEPSGKIEIWDQEGCFRYVGRWLFEVKVSESPFDLTKRLILCGLRPINNLVDITNYVMLELGQPLHAFDWDRVSGARIIVRRAKAGESLKFLDDVEREFSPEDLVIADAEKPLVLAGVMGGEDSGVSAETSTVFLESAWFDHKTVRLSALRHRLRTESSYRFERKVDPEGVYLAMLRATELMLRYAQPKRVSCILDVYPVKYTPIRIVLPKQRVPAYLGFEVPEEKIVRTLSGLGELEVKERDFEFVPASYRQDLSIPEDLIEEIARVFGYDKVPTTYPESILYVEPKSERLNLVHRLKSLLCASGFHEVITYSFTDPRLIELLNLPQSDQRSSPMRLENPLSQETSVLRTTIIPCLLQVLAYNQAREVESLKIFEIGKVFFKASKLAGERTNLALLLAGEKSSLSWYEDPEPFDSYHLKGVLEGIAESLRISFSFKSHSTEPFLKRGLSYDLYLDGEKVGFLGRLKNLIAKELDLREPVLVAEIYLDQVFQNLIQDKAIEVKKPPKFPSTTRDLSLVVKKNLPYELLHRLLMAKNVPSLSDFKLIKVYEGKPLSEDERSLTLRLWFRAEERTLRDEEVDAILADLISALTQELDVRLR